MLKVPKLLKLEIQHIFLIVGSIFGLLFVFILPPFQVPDELAHFYKAYAISESQFLCSSVGDSDAGSYLPSNITEFVVSTDSTNTKRNVESLKNESKYYPSHEKVFVEHYSSCVYNIVPYIPQALGILIGNLLNLNFIWIFYLGRLLNLLAYLLICMYSIRLTPRLKNVVLLLALMPMSLHQAGSLSADALTNALSFLFVCYILNMKYKEESYLNRRNFIIITVLGVLISLMKISYFPLSLFVFLIPYTKYKTIKQYLIKNTLIVFLSTFAAVGWLLITRTMNIHFPIDSTVQLNKILQDPLGYLYLMFKNIFNYDSLYSQFVGILGWINIPLPMILYILYFVAFFVVVFIEGSKEKEQIKGGILSSIISLCVFLISYILIETSLYLNWPQDTPGIVTGVQGRYFIPIVLVFFYGLYLLVPTLIKYSKFVVCIFLIAVMIISSMKIIDHYYFFGPKYGLLEPDNNHYIEGGILADTELFQSFTADRNNLSGISIYISTFQKQINNSYVLELRNEKDLSIIRRVQLNVKKIADNAYFDILFEPILNSKGEKYVISVVPLEKKVTEPITFQLSKPDIYADGDLIIKGKNYEEDIVFRLLY